MSQSFHDRKLIDVTEVRQQSLGHKKYEDNNCFMSAPDLFVAPKITEELGSKVEQSKVKFVTSIIPVFLSQMLLLLYFL